MFQTFRWHSVPTLMIRFYWLTSVDLTWPCWQVDFCLFCFCLSVFDRSTCVNFLPFKVCHSFLSFVLQMSVQTLLLCSVSFYLFLPFFLTHSVWVLSFLSLSLSSLWSLSLLPSIFYLCVFTSLFLTTVIVSPVPIWRKCNYSQDSISFDSLILFSWPDNIVLYCKVQYYFLFFVLIPQPAFKNGRIWTRR
jgi:hypothetical protein